ncbi:MAG: G5 domain-containing protein [Peptostreptococcaceae bacterium]
MDKKKRKVILTICLCTSLLALTLGTYWKLNKEQITIQYSGKIIKASTFAKDVRALLNENNIEYDSNDKISPSLGTKLDDYMEIEVIKVDIKSKKEFEKIPFEITIIEDKNLLKGKTFVKQDGECGEKTITYELTYENGNLVEDKIIKEEISKEPVEKVVNKGIKQEFTVASRENLSRGGNHMEVVATAYAGDTITSTGTRPRWGTIAVDPSIIPYGTNVYIPQFNMTFTAEDCGGAIKGNKIDIFMSSEKECYNWGRRTIDIYVHK